MKVVFELEMREMSFNQEKTIYNNLWWDFKPNKFGITHLVEKYDDLTEWPSYTIYSGNKIFAYGEGDPLDPTKQGCGGLSVPVEIIGAEYMFKGAV